MARLFISYKTEEREYAYAVRQWLMDEQGWASDDIFVDAEHLRAGAEWQPKLLAEAERAEVLLFLASQRSIHPDSFCKQELYAARGHLVVVTLPGLDPMDVALRSMLPARAEKRQITALDQQPTRPFPFSFGGVNGSVDLNQRQVEGIGEALRALGVAPDSFSWTHNDDGPFPGLRALQEGDEAVFCGRALEIRDGIKALEDLAAWETQRALIVQAPSGAGKSSFLRAGLWARLRQHPAFTPLAVVRTPRGVLRHPEWGLAAGLFDAQQRAPRLRGRLSFSRHDLAEQIGRDLPGLLTRFADADAGAAGRRTLLLGVDQAEEIAALSGADAGEWAGLLGALLALPAELDLRLVLTARDDSVDAVLGHLAGAGLPEDRVTCWPLHRLPLTRLREVLTGPAEAAKHWPLALEPALVDALASAAAAGGEGGDALPVLALAVQRLVARRRAPDGRVGLPAVEARAFLQGAVQEAADEALAAGGATAEDLRRLVIPQLADVVDALGGEVVAKRRVAAAADLFHGERAALWPLADRLVEQRLLTCSGDLYEVAHEALLRVEPLGAMIFARREQFELARAVRSEARAWAEAPKLDRLARAGERLQQARELLADPDFGPDLAREDGVSAYLEACDAHQRQQRDRMRRVTARAFVAPAERAVAEGRYDAAVRLMAAGAVLADDPNLSHVPELWRAARRAVFEGRTRAALWHDFGVTAASFSPDGSRVVTASYDNTARVWDAATGLEVSRFVGHEHVKAQFVNEQGVTAASFSPDGARVVTASYDRTARVWDAATGVELVRMGGHEREVLVASFSPDGVHVVTASDDGSARVWDAATGAEVARLQGHDGWLMAASFCPDGSQVVTASNDKTARVWDVATGGEVARLQHERWVRAASFSPDGSRVVTASDDGTARVWDAVTGTEVVCLRGHEHGVTAASFSPDGSRVVTASTDGRVWDAVTGAEVARLRGHKHSVTAASFSPDGSRVVTASHDHTARLWDAATGAEMARLRGHGRSVTAASFSPDGSRVITATDQGQAALVWEAATGAEIARLVGHEDVVASASFILEEAQVVTASWDGTVRLWDAAIDAQVAHVVGGERGERAAWFRSDGARVVTTSEDHVARVWDSVTGVELVRLVGHERGIRAASFSPNGGQVVTASDDKTGRVWEVATGAQVLRLDGHERAVRDVSFSPDGVRLVTASDDKTARVWDAATGASIARLVGHEGGVTASLFSPDGSRVVTVSGDRTVRVWDAASGAEVACLAGHAMKVATASFSPDGTLVVTASHDGTARVWDAATGANLTRMRHKDSLRAASFSPDGSRVVTASMDQTVRVWDATAGAEVACLEGHNGGVNAASFSQDGGRVVTASGDHTARVWDVSSTAAVGFSVHTLLLAATGRGLGARTPQEAADLLLQEAPEDLNAALRALRPVDEGAVRAAAAALFAPRHPNCYLSPTQFAARFGGAPQREAPPTEPSPRAAPPAPEAQEPPADPAPIEVPAELEPQPAPPSDLRETATATAERRAEPAPPTPAGPRPVGGAALAALTFLAGGAIVYALVRLGYIPVP